MHVVRFDRREAEALVEATSLLASVAMGQLGEIAQIWRMRRDAAELRWGSETLKLAWRAVGGLPRGAYFDVGDRRVPEAAKAAWDVYKAIRHRMAWEESPEGGVAQAFKTPRPVASAAMPSLSGDREAGYELSAEAAHVEACSAALELRERIDALDFAAVLAWLPMPSNREAALSALRSAADRLGGRTGAATDCLAARRSLAEALKGADAARSFGI